MSYRWTIPPKEEVGSTLTRSPTQPATFGNIPLSNTVGWIASPPWNVGPNSPEQCFFHAKPTSQKVSEDRTMGQVASRNRACSPARNPRPGSSGLCQQMDLGKMVEEPRVELGIPHCRCGVLPLALLPQKVLLDKPGIEPGSAQQVRGYQSHLPRKSWRGQ